MDSTNSFIIYQDKIKQLKKQKIHLVQ